MPRSKKGIKAGLSPQPPQDVLPPRTYELSPEERATLRIFLESMVWRKCLSNARTAKPGTFVEAKGKFSAQIRNDQLCRIQGWELFENAIMLQMFTPPMKRPMTPDNYPDSGRLIPPANKS